MNTPYEEMAARILVALDKGKAPISWHCIDEPDLIETIARELRKIDREECSDEEN